MRRTGSMAAHEFTLPKLALRIPTEAGACKLMEELRWEGGQPPACPLCGEVGRCYFLKPANGTGRATRTGKVSRRRVWKCVGCPKQFSVLTGTIFKGTRVPLRTWVFVIVDPCSGKNGLSAREVERKYGDTVKTAWSCSTPFSTRWGWSIGRTPARRRAGGRDVDWRCT